ncbi:hypothetical protein F511_13372 [Dorcoceras hygrometricum]|uniref:Uncharacterized protein n=1 Tax=Dorcoceras hygrometricum TaxID=472368 RepID=A0A2Z7BBR0_9LAMI|nr:hypothetical protein F511_13372 [Dorcoceras hygrometricum]
MQEHHRRNFKIHHPLDSMLEAAVVERKVTLRGKENNLNDRVPVFLPVRMNLNR